MAKQGQPSPDSAERISAADHQALARFRRSIAEARSDLAALKREAQSAGGAVEAVLAPTADLTAGARSLSTAVQTLEFALQEFGRRGRPLYLGPPPARPGIGIVLFFLLGLCGVVWWLFHAGPPWEPSGRVSDLDPAPPIIRAPDHPRPDPASRRLVPVPVPVPEPADPPAVLDPVPPPATPPPRLPRPADPPARPAPPAPGE